MNMAKRVFTIVAAAVIVAVLVLAMSSTVLAASSTMTVGANETWTVHQSTALGKLVIAGGATVTADPGHSLTLTVNGIETRIVPGTYVGLVLLTVTDEVQVSQVGGPPGPAAILRAAITANDSALVPSESVMGAIFGGIVSNTKADNVKITSVGPLFGGFMIGGSSTYTINNPWIDFTGPGANDFVGSGAGIRVDGAANVSVNRAHIVTNGVIRGAIFAGGDSIVTVNNSYIKTGNPPPPSADESFGAFMTSVPWPLGLTGTCRATLAVGNAKVTYNNSTITADGWGALSTDAVTGYVTLTANNCTVNTVNSGYGAYADGRSLDTFNDTTFNVHDMALIFTQGSAIFNHSLVNSGRFGAMQHSGVSEGNEVLTITNGTVFNTAEACIMIKNSAPVINVDNSTLNSANGVILDCMLSDDHGAGVEAAGSKTVANFSNMVLKGDIINSCTGVLWKKAQDGQEYMVGGDLDVNLKNVTISGAITTSTHKDWFQLNGVDNSMMNPFDPSNAQYAPYIGLGTDTYGPPDNDGDGKVDPYGLKLTLDGQSEWIVTKTSYLTGLTFETGTIQPPEGYKLSMTVNGTPVLMRGGSYTGSIVLALTPLSVFGGTSIAPQLLPATN
jgi:hypothetical protein